MFVIVGTGVPDGPPLLCLLPCLQIPPNAWSEHFGRKTKKSKPLRLLQVVAFATYYTLCGGILAKFVVLGAKTNAILFKMQHKMLNFDIFLQKVLTQGK